jgi:hypothetical protein
MPLTQREHDLVLGLKQRIPAQQRRKTAGALNLEQQSAAGGGGRRRGTGGVGVRAAARAAARARAATAASIFARVRIIPLAEARRAPAPLRLPIITRKDEPLPWPP